MVARPVALSQPEGDALAMGELINVIDEWRDKHGRPSDASISRAISNSDKTVNAWRNHGIKAMPERETLRRLAAFLNKPIEALVMAAATDVGYFKDGDGDDRDAASIG